MKKKQEWCLIIFTCLLVAGNLWLLTVPLLAAECTASCGECPSVTCEGAGACIATDDEGCAVKVGTAILDEKNCCEEEIIE